MSSTTQSLYREIKSKDLVSVTLITQKRTKCDELSLRIPEFPKTIIWNLIILGTVLFNYVLVTLNLSFAPDRLFTFLPFYITFDLIYIVNFVLLSLQRFSKPLKTKLSKTISTPIAYLILDLLSIIPQAILFAPVFDARLSFLIPYFRIATFLRLHCLSIFGKELEKLQKIRWLWYLVQYGLVLFLVVHTTIFIWYSIDFDSNHLPEKVLKNTTGQTQSSNPEKWYFMHTYGTIQILFGVGYGDVTPQNLAEVSLFIVLFILGQMLLLWLVASLASILLDKGANGVYIAQKQEDIAKYVEDIDPSVESKTNQYYEAFWTMNTPSILGVLPTSLTGTLNYDINCGLLHRSILLKDLPELVLKNLSSVFKHVRLLPGDVIYHQFVVKTSMVGVENGVLEVLHNEDGESPVIFFRKGTILGEMALFYNIPSKATVRATELTDLIVLEKKDFMRVMRHFPDVVRKLKNNIDKRPGDVSARRKLISKPFSVTNLRRLKRKLNETVENEEDDTEISRDYKKLYKIPGKKHGFLDSIVCIDKDSFRWILQENSLLLTSWKIINSFIQISYCLAYPYFVAFQRAREPLVEFGFIADVLNFLGVLLQCITAVNVEGQELLTSVPRIIDHRLDDWRFDFDILSLFPIEVWGYILESPVERIRYYDLFKFNRLLRLHKVKDLVELFDNDKRRTTYVGCVLRITLYSFLILYYFSCLLHLNGCFHEVCDSTSWYFLGTFDWDEKNHPKHPVVDSIFFTSTAFFSSGFMEYLPQTASDIVIVLAVMFSGLIFTSYFTARLISTGYFEMIHVGSSRLRPIFRSFSSFCRISYSARQRIQRILKIVPCASSEETKQFIKGTASTYLQSSVESCKIGNVLAETPLFRMVDGYFLTLMEKEAKLLKLPSNEVLYSLGNATRELFVLQLGSCDVFDAEDGVARKVGPGCQLGVLETLFGMPKRHTVVTVTDCVFVRVEYAALHKVLQVFPKEQEALEAAVFAEDMVRAVKRLQLVEEPEAFFDAIDHREVDQHCFLNQTKNWANYCRVFQRKMGSLWLLGILLMPVSIHPEGFFLTLWCSLRCFLIVVCSVLEPITVLVPPFADELYWWLVISHSSIYIDMYLSLHIAYYDGRGSFKVHPAYTSWYYLTHGFIVDLFSALPWDQLISQSNHVDKEIDLLAPHHHHNPWKLLKLLQLYKVFRFIGYFEKDLFKRSGTLRLFKIALALVVVVNFFANLGMRQICRYRFHGADGRVAAVWDDGNGTTYKGYLNCDGGFWRDNSLFDRMTDPLEVLLTGIYGVVNIITTTSLGDLKPTTSAILIGTTLATIVGFIVFSIFTSIVASIMLERAEETFEYRESVTQLMTFFNSKKLSSELKKKALRHFELTWERTRGDIFSSYKKMQATVPLLTDILLNYYQNILEEVPLFYDLDTNLLRMFVDKIKVKYFRKGQIIVRPKDLISDMFIVASGQIEVISDRPGQTEILEVSAIFGNIQRSMYSMSSMSAVARRNVELWVIDTAELFGTVKYYPVVLDDMDNVWKRKLFHMASMVRADDISSQSQEVDVVDQMESEVEEITRKSSILLHKYKPVQFCIPQRWFRFALKPNHDVFKVLDFITIFSSILNMFAIPYVFVTQENSFAGYVYLVFEPVYYLRVFFKLHQSHVNFYGNLVKTNSKIYKRYLNSSRQVFWDIAPNLPVYFTCFIFPRHEWFFSYSCLRLLHLLRFIYISEYFSTYGKKLGAKYWLLLAKTVLYYSFLIHIVTCIWFMLSCPFGNCHPDSWIFKFGNDISEKHVCYKMLLSYYYVLTLLTTTGIGDVFPKNILELCFTLITILIGKIMMSILIGALLSYFYQSRKKLIEYERDSKLLLQYLGNKKVSKYLVQRTWAFLKNQWDHDKCLTVPNKIFEDLPYPLRQDISISLYGDYLRDTFLFKDIDESLLGQICSKLHRRIFFQQDYIVKHGQMDSTMYFVLEGDVRVSTRNDDLTDTHHVILHAKDLFGVSQGLNLEAYHNFCYRPHEREAEVLMLKFEDWSYMLGFFPRDNQKIFSRVQSAYLQ